MSANKQDFAKSAAITTTIKMSSDQKPSTFESVSSKFKPSFMNRLKIESKTSTL